MKKITTLYGFLFFFTIANGQIKQGSVLIGGQFSYSESRTSTNYDPGTPNKNTTVVLSVGKAFKENDVYGISIGYLPHSYSSSLYIGGYSPTDENTIAASFYNRKYSKIITALYAFGEIGVGASYSNKSSTYYGTQTLPVSDNAYSGFLYFTPGVAYRIHKNIFLEFLMPNLARLSYYTSKVTAPDGSGYTTTHKYDYFGLSSSLGFSNIATGIRINL